MTILNKIKEKQAEITKKLMLLELDSRFNKLVRILKEKQIKIDEMFLNKTDKQDRDWQKYYADLCLFLEQDIMVVVNLYNHHKNDELSIYDDSTKEIVDALLLKEQEIKKCIQDTADNYHDDVLTNYIKTKYEMIMSKFQADLQDLLNRNEIALINDLTDNYQEVMPLTVYNNSTLVRERCLDELSSVLDDFINYVKSLIENKKIIAEKEQLIEKTINKINNQELLAKFNNIKNNYYESITHIKSVDMRIGSLQKNYFQELDELLTEVMKFEQIYDLQVQVTDYFTYLKETNPVNFEFSKLSEIKTYLQTNNNYELQKLLNRAYYEVIKLEVRYNNGATYLYSGLSEEMRLDLELLFLEDIKNNKELLIKNNCLEEFLTSDFSLTLLTKYTEMVMPEQVNEIVLKYQKELINKKNSVAKVNFKQVLNFTSTKKMFDDFGEAELQVYDEHGFSQSFHVNRDGYILNRRLSFIKAGVSNFEKIKYHDGFFTCIGYKREKDDTGYYHKYYLVIYDGIKNEVCGLKKIPSRKTITDVYEYSDGMVGVTYKNDNYLYFYNKYGKFQFKTLYYCSERCFNNGYLAQTDADEIRYLDKHGRVVYRKSNGLDFSATSRIFLKQAGSFNHGIAVIKYSSYNQIIDSNFRPVLTEYEYLEHEVIGLDNQKHFLPYFKDHQDGTTYVWEKGKLIPMAVEDLAGYYLLENYAFGVNYEGQLSFVKKNVNYINSFLDILGKICDNSASLTNLLKGGELKHIPFRELVANERDRAVISQEKKASLSPMKDDDKTFASNWEKIYRSTLQDTSNIITAQEVHKRFDELIVVNDSEHRLVLKR